MRCLPGSQTLMDIEITSEAHGVWTCFMYQAKTRPRLDKPSRRDLHSRREHTIYLDLHARRPWGQPRKSWG